MKKKIYFIISAILQILASANLIASSSEVFEKTIITIKDMYSSFPVEFQDRVISVMNNVGIYFIIGPAIICIIVNTIILIFVFTNKIVEKRSLLIFLSVLCILLSGNTLEMILAIANFIIILSTKKEKTKIVIEEKNNLPKVKNGIVSKRKLIISAVIFFTYFSHFLLKYLMPDNNNIISILVIISFYVIMFILIFILFGDKIVTDFKMLIKNFNAYIEYDLPKYGFMILSFLIVNIICIIITKNATSVNQEAVESLPKIVLAILAIIWAPIVEEIVFREAIRNYIYHTWLFIIISGFIFGFLHAAGEGSLFEIIMTTLPYATLGGWLAYIYAKTDNIANNIMIHSIWNLFAVIMSFLIGFII